MVFFEQIVHSETQKNYATFLETSHFEKNAAK